MRATSAAAASNCLMSVDGLHGSRWVGSREGLNSASAGLLRFVGLAALAQAQHLLPHLEVAAAGAAQPFSRRFSAVLARA